MARYLFIDIDRELNIILSEKKKDSLKLLKTIKVSREESRRIRADLNSGLSGLKAPVCYLSLPVSMLGFRIIELPFSEEERIREVLPFELKEKVMEPFGDLVYDFVKLPSDREKAQKILAVYTRKDELSSMIKGFSEAGIEPDIIGSLGLRHIIEKGLKTEDLLNPPGYDESLVELLRKEIERPVINLLRGGFGLAVERENLVKRLKTTNLLLLAIVMVLILTFAFSIKREHSEALKIRTFIKEEYRKEFPQESIKDELLQLKSHLREIKDKKEILTGIPVAEVLERIKPPSGITIESVDMDSRGITLRGEARDLAGVEAFREKLREGFGNPSIVESAQFSSKFRFTIKAER